MHTVIWEEILEKIENMK